MTVGQRIAAYRRRRGMSQAALAGLVGRSESWLSQVERGMRSVDRLSVLLDMAKILHVEVEALTGRPWQYAPNGGPVVSGLDQVRRVFTRYDHLMGTDAEPPCTLAELKQRSVQAHRDYQAARYDSVIEQLPALMLCVDGIHRAGSEQDKREMLLTYVSTYVAAAKLLTKLGVADLAGIAADRAATAASDADSLNARGVTAYQVVCALLRADRTEEAEDVAVRMAELITPKARADEPSLISVAGALWLIAAVIAGRRNERADAWRRLDQADVLAQRLGFDANFEWTAFGPTNVAIHRVSVAAELGDAGEALRLAQYVEPANLPDGLFSRRAQVHLDLAWAQAQRKRDAEATLNLLDAERVAPEAVRYNVIVREIVREILARGKAGKSSALHDLAVRAGVLD
jgi:transcriptional regulator with XRE-family HTH domain